MNLQKKKYKVTCIFHKGCMDGWMSALPVWLIYSDVAEMTFVPAHYSDTPPDVTGCDFVFIVDFSYKPEVMLNWQTGNSEVFLIDHHTKAIQELVDCAGLCLRKERDLKNGQVYQTQRSNRWLTAYLAFNEGKDHKDQASGAGLTMDFLAEFLSWNTGLSDMEGPHWEDVKKTIEISQSYDLWHHDGLEDHPNTHLSMFFKYWEKNNRVKFNQMLSHPQDSHVLMMELASDWLMTSLDQKLIYGAHAVVEQGVVCRALCSTAYEVKLPVTGYSDVKIGFIPGEKLDVSVSMLGSIAVREFGWDVMVMIAAVKENEYVLSMRSNENAKNVDVADICDQIGRGPYGLSGGGHRNASGCTILKKDLQEVVAKTILL